MATGTRIALPLAESMSKVTQPKLLVDRVVVSLFSPLRDLQGRASIICNAQKTWTIMSTEFEMQPRTFYSDAIVNVYSLALCPTPSIAVISLWQLHVDLMPTNNEIDKVLPNRFENCVLRGTQRASNCIKWWLCKSCNNPVKAIDGYYCPTQTVTGRWLSAASWNKTASTTCIRF